jgi:hypothetical protein
MHLSIFTQKKKLTENIKDFHLAESCIKIYAQPHSFLGVSQSRRRPAIVAYGMQGSKSYSFAMQDRSFSIECSRKSEVVYFNESYCRNTADFSFDEAKQGDTVVCYNERCQTRVILSEWPGMGSLPPTTTTESVLTYCFNKLPYEVQKSRTFWCDFELAARPCMGYWNGSRQLLILALDCIVVSEYQYYLVTGNI